MCHESLRGHESLRDPVTLPCLLSALTVSSSEPPAALPANHFTSADSSSCSCSSSLGMSRADPNNVVERELFALLLPDLREAHLKSKASVHDHFITVNEALKLGAPVNSYCATERRSSALEGRP